MKEEEKTEEEEKPKKTIKSIEEANLAAERLENANIKKEELLNREEELLSKRILGGYSEAGGEKQKKEPISDIEFSKKLMQGEIDEEDIFK